MSITAAQFAILGVAAFALTGLLTWPVRALAIRLGAMDAPNMARKTQAQPVPYLGGIAIALGISIITLGAVFVGADNFAGENNDQLKDLALTVLLPALVLAPVAMPEILLGIALLLFFRQVLDLTLGFWSILIAHMTFSLGAVAMIVQSRLTGMDKNVVEAARDLGANPWQAFRYVMLPLIMPAVTAGFLVAFTLSIDDFVITFFNAGVSIKTLPLQIYSMIKVAVTPEVNAVSTLLMAVTLTLIALASRIVPDAIHKFRTD